MIDVTDVAWGEELEGKTCVLVFSASWCMPCSALKPVLEEVEEETGLDMFHIDVDDQEVLTGKFGIRSVPTTVFIKNGNFVESMVGAVSKKRLLDAAEKIL